MIEPPPCRPAAPAISSDDDAPLCPQCGYDLRGSDSGRCSECGLEVDRATLLVSSIPWAHRRRTGRIRAYLWTVWLVTIGSRKLRHEASKPQSLADARRFQWITGGWVALVLAGVFIAVVAEEGGFAFLAMQPRQALYMDEARITLLDDLAVPWCAGVTIPPVAPIALAIFGWAMTATPRGLFRNAKAERAGERSEALPLYATAPMFLLMPAAMLMAAVPLGASRSTADPLLGIAGVLHALKILLTITRVPVAGAREAVDGSRLDRSTPAAGGLVAGRGADPRPPPRVHRCPVARDRQLPLTMAA